VGGTGSGVVGGLGVCLCSSMGWFIKGWTLLSGHPLSFGFPLLGALSLKGMNWEVSQKELDLWQSQAGADCC